MLQHDTQPQETNTHLPAPGEGFVAPAEDLLLGATALREASEHPEAASNNEDTGRHRRDHRNGRRFVALALTGTLTVASLGSSEAPSGDETIRGTQVVSLDKTLDHPRRIVTQAPANTAEAPANVSAPYEATDWHAELGPELKPRLFDRRELPNAKNIGALEIVYNPANDAKRDKLWGSINRYWASIGKTFKNGAKHPDPGSSLVHPLVSDLYNTEQPLPKSYRGLTAEQSDHKILDNGFVMDNQPGKNPNIMVVAGHNVTPVPTEVQLGDKLHKNPRMGINAPLVNGDQVNMYVPDPEEKGVAIVYTFTLVKQFVTPMSDPDGYNNLYKMKATPDDPVLVMYHCTPEGLATERHVSVYKWETTSEQRTALKRIK